MSKIPINEVYFVSKHVKSSNQRGVVRRWSRTEVSQSSMSRISINEVYFVSKQACAKRARERERERERRRGKHGKNSNQRGVLRLQACQEFQSTRCTSFQSVSKHVKNSNQRGILCLGGALRRWSGTGVGQPSMSRILVREREREGGKEGQAFQSTRCNSSPSMSRIPINEAMTCTLSPSSGKARNL